LASKQQPKASVDVLCVTVATCHALAMRLVGMSLTGQGRGRPIEWLRRDGYGGDHPPV